MVIEILLCGLGYLCVSDTCFSPGSELRQHLALYTPHNVVVSSIPDGSRTETVLANSTVNQRCTQTVMVILAFLNLYRPRISPI